MGFKLVDVRETFPEFDSLLGGDCPIYSSLDLLHGSFAAAIHKGCHIKCFSRMCKDLIDDRTRAFPKNIAEDIIKLKVRYSETVMGSVFLSDQHVGELEPITAKITKLPDIRRRDKTGLDHPTHEEITDPFGVLAIRLVTFLGLCVFRMSNDAVAGLFKDVKHWDPILAGRFHADFRTVIFGKPGRQFQQSL